MTSIKQYLPILGMVLAAVLNVLYLALQDGALSAVEILNLVIALCGAIVLYVVPRFPGLTWLKPLTAAVTAAVMVLIDAIQGGGITQSTWVMAAIQFLVGLGIVAATNSNVPLYTARHAPPPA